MRPDEEVVAEHMLDAVVRIADARHEEFCERAVCSRFPVHELVGYVDSDGSAQETHREREADELELSRGSLDQRVDRPY
jgi:hypothetical protein